MEPAADDVHHRQWEQAAPAELSPERDPVRRGGRARGRRRHREERIGAEPGAVLAPVELDEQRVQALLIEGAPAEQRRSDRLRHPFATAPEDASCRRSVRGRRRGARAPRGARSRRPRARSNVRAFHRRARGRPRASAGRPSRGSLARGAPRSSRSPHGTPDEAEHGRERIGWIEEQPRPQRPGRLALGSREVLGG